MKQLLFGLEDSPTIVDHHIETELECSEELIENLQRTSFYKD